jgi:hypothetical protein
LSEARWESEKNQIKNYAAKKSVWFSTTVTYTSGDLDEGSLHNLGGLLVLGDHIGVGQSGVLNNLGLGDLGVLGDNLLVVGVNINGLGIRHSLD